MVIALVAGVGRVSCAQVQFAPASDRLQDLPKNGKCENYP